MTLTAACAAGKPGYSGAVSTDDRELVEEEVARGWDSLEDGDLEAAQRAHDRARSRAPDHPEVIALGGALVSVTGEPEDALAAFMRAHERAPGTTRHLVHAADVELGLLDRPERAIALCDRIMDETGEEHDLIDAVLLKAEALVSLGDRDAEAREVLAELEGCAVGDPALWCRAGDMHLTLGDLEAAERAYRAAVDEDERWADGHHGLGLVHAARGDRERRTRAWLRTRELDLAGVHMPWHMSEDEFAEVAERALAELPEEVHARLENVPVLIDQVPSKDLVRSGVDPRLLGLFTGVPYPYKSHIVDGLAPHIDTVHLFQRNLERATRSREHLMEEIRITVLHETAHFFGLEDADLDKLGLG